MPDENRNIIKSPGIVLTRKISGENNLRVSLFLKDYGIIEPLSTSNKKLFGATEPLTLGNFNLEKSQKSGNYFLEEAEILDDFLIFRVTPKKLYIAIEWTKKIIKNLIPGHPDNLLLANLYYSMELLKNKNIPVNLVDFKFTWKWLNIWGLAPDLINFYVSKNFDQENIKILLEISILSTKNILNLYSDGSLNHKNDMFAYAVKLISGFLQMK